VLTLPPHTSCDTGILAQACKTTKRKPLFCRKKCQRNVPARDKRILYSRTPANLGAARNFNRAFRLSRGEYFKWAAADDVLEPTFLERCVQVLDEDPTIVLAYTRVTNFDEWDVVRGGTFRYDLADLRMPAAYDRFRQMFLYVSVYPIFGLIRASVLRRTPLFRPHIGADDCLLVDLALRGKFGEVPERLLRLRARPGCYTSDLTWVKRSGGREGPAQARWWDPQSKGQVVLPYCSRLWEHFVMAARANVALDQKLLIGAFLCRVANWWRPQLRKELGNALRRVLRGDLEAADPTCRTPRRSGLHSKPRVPSGVPPFSKSDAPRASPVLQPNE